MLCAIWTICQSVAGASMGELQYQLARRNITRGQKLLRGTL